MPVHDWTRVSAGGFHNFHQDWTIEIYRTLNRGLLPPGYAAYTDLRVGGFEPDVVSIEAGGPPSSGGHAVTEAPPRTRHVARVESDAAVYARKANRISVRHESGRIVAIIEVVSPGNKDSKSSFASFIREAVEFLRSGISFLVIDLFPPGPRDPDGIHRAIWDELTDQPMEARPDDKPLTIASCDAGDGEGLTAYVDPIAVGDPLPPGYLFLAPGRYVEVPLESTYMACFEATPAPIGAGVTGT